MKRFNKITPKTMRIRIVYRQSTDHSEGEVAFLVSGWLLALRLSETRLKRPKKGHFYGRPSC